MLRVQTKLLIQYSHHADLGIAFNPSFEKDFHQIAVRRYVMCAVVRRACGAD